MVGLKAKKRVFAELLLVHGFIRPIASGWSQNLLCMTPLGSKIPPSLFVKFRHYKVVLTYCYSMIIFVAKKKFFNSIWPVLKSIILREIIAFFHSFVSVRYLIFYHFVLFCFIFSFPPTNTEGVSQWTFFFFCGRCQLINTWIFLIECPD